MQPPSRPPHPPFASAPTAFTTTVASARFAPADAFVLCVVLAAAVFMLWAAGHYTVFDDEAFSCRRYVLDTPELIAALRRRVEPDPPLYYLLVHSWIGRFGLEPIALRSLSIVVFFAGVSFLAAAGAALGGRPTARLAALLAMLHPLHLFFGFAARWYALLFACVAGLLWTTSRLAFAETRWAGRRRIIGCAAWCLFATAACYTNYFGICIVGLTWLAAITRQWRDRRARLTWIICADVVLVLYLPWLTVFFGELTRFPTASSEPLAYAATAARTAVALLTGNLADPGGLSRGDPGAWWVWLPMAGCAVTAAAAIVLSRGVTRCGWLAWITGMSLAAGIGTLTLIDKYVMSFSAAAVLLVAVGLSRTEVARGGAPRVSRLRVASLALLAIAWAGGYVNLARERHWSSLRWIDPLEPIVADASRSLGPQDVVAATHPSAGYYWGLLRGYRPAVARGAAVAEAIGEWRAASQQVVNPARPNAAEQLVAAGAARIVLIETVAVGDAADALDRFKRVIEGRYRLANRTPHLLDPAARRKNRIDPAYHHPTHRVVVYEYGKMK